MKKNLKGTWPQALKTFISPLLLVLTVRWALIEPFVIPSGSMIPNLLVHDHIVVEKFSYGLKVPFVDRWIFRWGSPSRGEVVVFKFPENPEIYYIKRLIGIPGDEVRVKNGKISVNGTPWSLEVVPQSEIKKLAPPFGEKEERFVYYLEKIDPPLVQESQVHQVRFYRDRDRESQKDEKIYRLGPAQYFFMGDNRDQSSDGRVWGFVDEKFLVGKAWRIWLSCEETLASAPFVCDPSKIRWHRLFGQVQ